VYVAYNLKRLPQTVMKYSNFAASVCNYCFSVIACKMTLLLSGQIV